MLDCGRVGCCQFSQQAHVRRRHPAVVNFSTGGGGNRSEEVCEWRTTSASSALDSNCYVTAMQCTFCNDTCQQPRKHTASGTGTRRSPASYSSRLA